MMTFVGKTIFITGGGAGIGRGLALALADRGAKVIISGPTQSKLDSVAAERTTIEVETLDVADAKAVTACAQRVVARHPSLSMVICNAGVQQIIDFSKPNDISDEMIAREIDINLRGVISVGRAFLPHLLRQPNATLVNVGSGLGYVPLAAAPVYSATKAAVHSFTISLRHQLRGSSVQVVEIIPPVVETALHRGQSRRPPRAMPLDAFIKAAVAGLERGTPEIAVGLAKVLRVTSRIVPGRMFKVINKT